MKSPVTNTLSRGMLIRNASTEEQLFCVPTRDGQQQGGTGWRKGTTLPSSGPERATGAAGVGQASIGGPMTAS